MLLLQSRSLPAESLVQDWQRLVESRTTSRRQIAAPLAAAGYLELESTRRKLIDVERLTFVALHAEPLWDQSVGIRVAGFRARRVPWGLSWGGVDGTAFEKDLELAPELGARGRRLDPAAGRRVLRLALDLYRKLNEPANDSDARTDRRLRLPPLWAAFRLADEASIQGDGPEFSGACHRHGQNARELLRGARREHCGLVLYPLDWVSHLWQRFVAIYADLLNFPRVQVIGLSDPAHDLSGYRGACEFDFYHSRFNRRGKSGNHIPRCRGSKTLRTQDRAASQLGVPVDPETAELAVSVAR